MYWPGQRHDPRRRFVALAAVATMSGYSIPAQSQDNVEQPAAAEASSPTVTGDDGKHSRDVDVDETAHRVVITAEQIALSGAMTLDELLTRWPTVTLQGVNRNRDRQHGLITVDLRNLGPQRTLVLVNGRRVVQSGPAGAVDLNTIPLALIERVELVLEGASALYGADALGGVINIILKDEFQGFQVDLSGGISTRLDAAETSVSATAGGIHDRGKMVLSLTYDHREPLPQVDRLWAREPVVWEWYETDEFGNNTNEVARVFGSSYHPAGYLWTADGSSYIFLPGNGKSYVPWEGGRDSSHRYNYGKDYFLIGGMDRISFTGSGTVELSDCVEAYLEGSYTHRETLLQESPIPVGYGTAAWPMTLEIPLTNPYIPQDFIDDLSEENQEAGYLYMYKRLAELGNRQWETTVNTFRLLLGMRGTIFNENYNWDVYGSYGRTRQLTAGLHSVNLTRLMQTLDPAICADYANLGCQVFDGFGENSLSPGVIDYIESTENQLTDWSLAAIGGRVEARPIELPGGRLRLILGGEGSFAQGTYQPDTAQTNGDSAAWGKVALDEEVRNTQEVFAGAHLPLINGLLGVDRLTAELAGRYTRYTAGNIFTYRVGLNYSPVASIALRGVLSTAYRLPNAAETYHGKNEEFIIANDPCMYWEQLSPAIGNNRHIIDNCRAEGVPEEHEGHIHGGRHVNNPSLKVETIRTLNLGVSYRPSFLPRSWHGRLSLDYYNIVMDDGIAPVGAQALLDTCYGSPNKSHRSCELIPARQGDHLSLVSSHYNHQEIHTSGIDTSIGLSIPIWVLRLSLGWHINYLSSYKEDYGLKSQSRYEIPTEEEEDDEVEHAGEIGFDGGSYAHWRWNFDLGLTGTNWRWSNQLYFIGEAEIDHWEPDPQPTSDVSSVVYWDTAGSYNVAQLMLTLGIKNLLDRDPPYMPEGGQNANESTYDFAGRFVYARIGYRF